MNYMNNMEKSTTWNEILKKELFPNEVCQRAKSFDTGIVSEHPTFIQYMETHEKPEFTMDILSRDALDLDDGFFQAIIHEDIWGATYMATLIEELDTVIDGTIDTTIDRIMDRTIDTTIDRIMDTTIDTK